MKADAFKLTMAAFLSLGLTVFAERDAQAQKSKTPRVASRIDSTPNRSSHPLAPVLKIAYKSRAKLENVKAYSALFDKKEIVGRQMISETMQMKVREKPFSVYLKYNKPHAGREIIYVDGRNNNMLLAHETGLAAIVGTVSLKPDSPRAMQENRYPITMIGISNMLETLIKQWELERKYGEVDVKYYTNVKLGSTSCDVIESSHPQKRRQFRFQKTRLYLDQKTRFPVRVQQYAFPTSAGGQSALVEQYTYSQLNTSANLKDVDFDTKNSSYGY